MSFSTLMLLGAMGGRAAAAGWNPLNITTVKLWLSSSRGTYADTAKTTGAVSNDPVKAWVGLDSLGNQIDFLKDSTSAVPVFKTNKFGGKPSVEFSASASQYLLAAGNLFTGMANHQVTIVGIGNKKSTTSGTPYVLFKNNSWGVRLANQKQPSIYAWGGAWLDSTFNLVGNSPSMWGITLNSAQDAEMYFNKSKKETVAGGANIAATNDVVYLGKHATSSFFYDGDMYDLLVIDGALSSDDWTNLFDYFKNFYTTPWVDTEINPDLYKGNHPADPLTTPTYDGSGQAMHPSVVDIERELGVGQTWNGYRYWMAMTPYTGADATIENPSILVSNDKTTWEVPPGLTNPIEPYAAPGENSDTELWFDATAGVMYCMWRKNISANLYYLRSTDGINWTDKTLMLTGEDNTRLISPGLIHDGIKFCLYSVINTDGNPVELRTSASLTGPWSAPILTNFSGQWHIGLDRYNGVTYINMSASEDGINFEGPLKSVFLNSLPAWMATGIYRAEYLHRGNGVDCWMSSQNGSNVWHTGYAELT